MGKRRNARPPAAPRRGTPAALAVAVLVALALVAGAAWLAGGGERSTAGAPAGSAVQGARAVPAVARRETRPTLDPALFIGKAALAHRVAREIPDTLDQLYCYCECDRHMGHKSLLSCYTDGHAAT